MSRNGKHKRAQRRQDAARMKHRARRIYPHDPEARNADHLAVCSCWMCGNARRIADRPTIQEVRAAARARDQLAEARAERAGRR